MSKLSDLLDAVYAAKDVLTEAEKQRDKFLEPILVVLGATGGGVSDCYHQNATMLHIGKEGSTRGCGWHDDYDFPTSIFEADDPVAAAKEFVEKKKQTEARQVRDQKLAQLKQLQKELVGE